MALAAVVAASEWLRSPSLAWVVVGVLAAVGAVLVAWPPREWRRLGLLMIVTGLAVGLALTQV
ncbi:MAG TPA: hypothetical protein VJ277_04255, partial [Gemmatimonadales bacterium]|nr:hypothetical protein [Gemmatimonadales bacterium]